MLTLIAMTSSWSMTAQAQQNVPAGAIVSRGRPNPIHCTIKYDCYTILRNWYSQADSVQMCDRVNAQCFSDAFEEQLKHPQKLGPIGMANLCKPKPSQP